MEKLDPAMKDVGGISLPNIVFDGLWAIVDSMKMCLIFQIKTQIVIDYDPQKEKWEIKYYQTKEEVKPNKYGASRTRKSLSSLLINPILHLGQGIPFPNVGEIEDTNSGN